jgi:hypothetical protein
MILTRYIYDKDNLQYSIFLALLNKDREQAKFWVYELYYSGFKTETFHLLWELYYKLYYISYPNMEKFMKVQTLLWMSNKLDDCIVGSIAESLAIRDPCIDTYFIIENKTQVSDVLVQEIVKVNNCVSKKECFVNLENLGISCKKNVKINKKINFTKNVFLELEMLDIEILKTAIISIILDTFVEKPLIKMRKNIYIIQQPYDMKQYKTKPAIKHHGYKIPPRECRYQLQINPNGQKFDYPDYYNWVYYASFSPLWKTRIERHNGIVLQDQQKIHFENEDDEVAFYNYFNLEPDEQSLEIEEQWFGHKPFESWNDLYNQFILK